VSVSGGDTHADLPLRQPSRHKLAIRSPNLPSPELGPYPPALAEATGMKVVNSLKSLKKRDKNCRIARRKGRAYMSSTRLIPGSKRARADPDGRLHDQLS
jgi:ribosomal protein L36